MKSFKNYVSTNNSITKRTKSLYFLFNIKKLNIKRLSLNPKQTLLFIIIYYLKKILRFLKTSRNTLNKTLKIELQIILKKHLYFLKHKNYQFKNLIKKTLTLLLKLKKYTEIPGITVIINKLLIFYIKNGYNVASFTNILKLKKNQDLNKKNNQGIFNKFIGIITKKGKKIKAKKIFLNALLKVRNELKLSSNLILLKIFTFLKTSVESKKIRVRRTFHLVPFPINKNRKTFLVAQWILFSLKNKKNNTKMFSERLSYEIIKLLKGLKSNAKKNKKYNIIKSLQNKSNLHFRW
jgi:ribosomal protein S7